MIQRIVSTATLALAFIGEVSATNKYTLVDDYAGTNFFDMFDFYTGADPTTGFVSYTSKEVAENANSDLGVALTKVENGQAYMGVDYVNVVTTGRPSVRIQSKESYTHGLIIADLAHMPASICGTWPAFWTVNTTNYPRYGEIDILENINEKTQRGGVYAMQWTSDVIRMWNFGPDAIPADITAGTPDPSTWDLPAFTTEGGVCNIDGLFANHKIIFDTTFCGGYAGQTGFWQETTCYDAEKYPTCDSYVGANPAAYKEAYWLINSVKVYQNDTLAATSAAAPVMSSTARAESLLGVATSEAASIASVVASSSLSSAACVSTGALLSGQTACPASSVEASSTASIVDSVSSVATIIPTTAPVEASSTANIIASVSSVQESSAAIIVPSASSIEQSSVAGVLTTASVPYPHTTSTIYGTNTRTDELGSVVTETVILSTTICPITAAEGKPPLHHPAQITVTLPGEDSSAIIVATSEIAQTTVPAAYTTQVSEPAYAWSTVTTEGTSTVVPVGSSPSVPASAESDSSVPTASAEASSGEATSVSSAACVPSGGALLSGQTACPETPAASTAVSSAACVASGALLSGETACPETPLKAVSSSAATSAQPSTTSVANTPIPTDASIVLSTATVVPMQSAPAPAATSAEGISTPQSSSVVGQAGTTSPIIFTPTYATTSFVTKPTSASTNSTSTQTITSSSVSITGTGILIDTSTLGSTETFTFAMPSIYSATGTSDASAVTAYPYLDSGVSKVSVRGSIMAAMGVMALLLVV
ncbi:endo-1,3(4)-beta-glucanase [Botrytis cinerea]